MALRVSIVWESFGSPNFRNLYRECHLGVFINVVPFLSSSASSQSDNDDDERTNKKKKMVKTSNGASTARTNKGKPDDSDSSDDDSDSSPSPPPPTSTFKAAKEKPSKIKGTAADELIFGIAFAESVVFIPCTFVGWLRDAECCCM